MAVLEVARWCDNCKKIFDATRVVVRRGREETVSETPCPDCKTPGTPLLDRGRR